MAIDPMTASIIGGVMPGLFGRGVAAPAPPFQAGFSSFQPRGLLDDQLQRTNQIIQQGTATPAMSIEELIGPPQAQGQELAPQVTAQDDEPVTSMPSVFNTVMQNEGIRREQEPGFFGKIGQGAEGFFGNLDQNLQSPSKVIGLGLLNRIDPRLAGVGLLAGGLLGKNKVF